MIGAHHLDDLGTRLPGAASRRRRGFSPLLRSLLGGSLALLLGACASSTPPPSPPREPAPPCESTPSQPLANAQVYRRAESSRALLLEAEIRRLEVDLRRAEDALVAAESGLRGNYSRADAVSSLAGQRIELERAAREAPWRAAEIELARKKLDEADLQIGDGHFGAALFFVYRASRVTDRVLAEAKLVRETSNTLFVEAQYANLRSGPSRQGEVLAVLSRGTPAFPESNSGRWVLVRTAAGPVGWVHRKLLKSK